MKRLSFILFIILSGSTSLWAQFYSMREVEHYVCGTWSEVTKTSGSGLIVTESNFEQSLTFNSNFSYTIDLGVLFDHKKLSGKWEIEKNDNGEYTVKATIPGAWNTISTYKIDGRDYLINEWKTKFRKTR